MSLQRDIVTQLRVEEARLLCKLHAIREVLAAYGNEVARERMVAARLSAYGTGVIDAVVAIMTERSDAPISTRDLVDLLSAKNISVRGRDKINALSLLLSRSGVVLSNGRKGWTMPPEVMTK